MMRQHGLQLDGTPAQRSFKCDSCDFSAFTNAEFKLHMMKHKGLKPYKCPICDFSTNEKGTLTKHVRLHTGEKPYPCDLCQMKFSHPSGLARHRIQHTGVKPHPCPHCQKSFIKKESLNAHLANHESIEPFRCQLCAYETHRRPALTLHMRKEHNYKASRRSCYSTRKGEKQIRVPFSEPEPPLEVQEVVEEKTEEQTVNFVYEGVDTTDTAMYNTYGGEYGATSEVCTEPQLTVLFNMAGHFECSISRP
jgi:KRAB domain-containing zinc finger protein